MTPPPVENMATSSLRLTAQDSRLNRKTSFPPTFYISKESIFLTNYGMLIPLGLMSVASGISMGQVWVTCLSLWPETVGMHRSKINIRRRW